MIRLENMLLRVQRRQNGTGVCAVYEDIWEILDNADFLAESALKQNREF